VDQQMVYDRVHKKNFPNGKEHLSGNFYFLRNGIHGLVFFTFYTHLERSFRIVFS